MKLTKEQLERLILLNEECAEVQHIISKIIRHSYESFDPTKNTTSITTNKEILAKEIGDLLYSIGMLIEMKDINEKEVSISTSARHFTIGKYLNQEVPKRNTIKDLFHHRDTTVGLYATDIEPNKIIINAIQTLPMMVSKESVEAISNYLIKTMFQLK